jgi:hypothetical protein
MADPHSVLQRHLARFALVRFVRPNLEAPGKHLIGVPVALGGRWVVMARMDDAIRLDGFDALRLSDIAAVETTFRRRSFYIRGLRMRRARIPMLSQLNLRTTRTLLEGVQRWYSLVTLDREAGSSAGCDVGKIIRFATRTCTMRLITPGADWVRAAYRVDYADVTRIGFGGEYEETLAAVAGMPDPKWR